MAKGLKHLLFLILMVLLWLPLLQRKFVFIPESPLMADVPAVERPETFRRGQPIEQYLSAWQQHIEVTIGLRTTLIRLRNQIFWSAFRIAKANSVVAGRNGVLFEAAYIDAYYGDDFAGEDSLLSKMVLWKELEDALQQLGVQAILVFAPGKAAFFPDDIPLELRQKKRPANYEFLHHLADSLKVTSVDLKAMFHIWADTSRYPLFPRYGTHWSDYGSMLAQRALRDSLQRILHRPMDEIVLHIEDGRMPSVSDRDIELGMNLLFALPTERLAYASASYCELGHAPKVLTIGDSFYWSLFNNGFATRIGRLGGFWFYFNQAYPIEVYPAQGVKHLDLRQEVLKNDVLILMMTEPQLARFGWGAVERLHGEFCRKGTN
jgi:hypothetical protein